MVLDPIPQSLPVHFFGSRPQPPTSRELMRARNTTDARERNTHNLLSTRTTASAWKESRPDVGSSKKSTPGSAVNSIPRFVRCAISCAISCVMCKHKCGCVCVQKCVCVYIQEGVPLDQSAVNQQIYSWICALRNRSCTISLRPVWTHIKRVRV